MYIKRKYLCESQQRSRVHIECIVDGVSKECEIHPNTRLVMGSSREN